MVTHVAEHVSTESHPPVTPTPAVGRVGAVIAALRCGDPDRIGRTVPALGPVLRDLYQRGEHAWQHGAPADFLAATLYASSRYHLRVHAHAPGARDTDLHTHKGTVYSTLLTGALVNTTAMPRFSTERGMGGLDVWQCACRPDGSPVQQRTGFAALIDPATVADEQLEAGQGFTVAPGEYHRLAIDRDPSVATVTLCLFERVDPDAPDAVVLTNRPTPVLADRDMTVTAARAALRHVLDTVTG